MELFFNKHIFFFLGALLFSFFINSILLRFVKTLGIRNNKDIDVRWSAKSKPALGGLTFYIVFLLSITLHPFVFSYHNIDMDFQTTGMIGAVSLGFLMGLADDAYNTKPLLKLIVQIVCGVILIYSGTYINLFENNIWNYTLTIVWVVGLMNSINMLDNMDGITTSVSLIILITILSVMLGHEHNPTYLTIVIGLIATLFCFLYFNWSPSKMFMGDTGSQFLGITLAGLSIHYLWNPVQNGSDFAISKQFIIPLLSFIIPIIDTTTVVIKRASKGKSPFVGGKDHTTHHLSYLGLSEKQVAIIMLIIAIVAAIMVYVIVNHIPKWMHAYTAIFGGFFLVVFFILFRIANKNIDKSENK
jgi:UDP-GlcNAc:undecaprenyl-phosphate GlcNAc-1-phosphate transferase